MRNLVFLLICLTNTLHAQQWEWTYVPGSWSDNQTPVLQMNAQGEVYTAVSQKITKHSTSGTLIWEQYIEGPNTRIHHMSIDQYGNCYVVGHCHQYLYFTDPAAGTYTVYACPEDKFIAAFDQSGQRKWVRFLPHYANWGNFLANTGSGDLIHACARTDSIWEIMKISPAGITSWNRTYSTTSPFGGMSKMVLDSKDNIHIAGFFAGGQLDIDGNVYYQCSGTFDRGSYLAKLDPAGNVLTVNAVQGQTWIQDMDFGGQDDLYIIGAFDSCMQVGSHLFVVDTCYANHCREYFIAKLDSAGNCSWANKGVSSFGSSLVAVSSGDFYVAGSYGGNVASARKFDASGSVQWTLSSSGSSIAACSATKIAFDGNGSIVIGGAYHSSQSYHAQCWFGTDTLPYTGFSTNLFIAKLSLTPTGMVENLSDSPITLFPNPSSGQFAVISREDMISVSVIDPLGQIIYYQPVSGYQTSVDLTAFAKGIYFVRTNCGEHTTMGKVIIE